MRMSTKGSQEQTPETTPTAEGVDEQRGSIRFPKFRRRTSSIVSTAASPSEPGSRKRRLIRRRRKSEPVEARDQPHDTTTLEGPTIRTAILTGYDVDGVEEVEIQESTEDEEQQETNDGNQLVRQHDENVKCATAILQHSFMLCGSPVNEEILMESINDVEPPPRARIPEDPTVQESIECVFASQLEAGLPHDLLWEEIQPQHSDLVSPASLLQTRTNSRLSVSSMETVRPRKTFRTGTLVHIGTYDPTQDRMTLSPVTKGKTCASFTPCKCQRGLRTPSYAVNDWPQRPLLLRPSPGSGTQVKGIRFVGFNDYLWKVGDSHTWMEKLHEHWGSTYTGPQLSGCPECMLLPINNGNEKPGESLVVDFVSPLFEGTLLLRLRYTNGTSKEPYSDDFGYFEGVNRRYQVVVQGRPRKPLPLDECFSGIQLERKFAKLPSKWIVKGAMKVMSFFAPQMKTDIEGDSPSSLTPLGSTPQVLRVNGDLNMEPRQEEPTIDSQTLLGKASEAPSSLQRARHRKKIVDKLYAQGSKSLVLSPSNTYTFEFLQHLFNFNDFSVELGSMLGSVPLKHSLDGQAMQIMATHEGKERLWSFDIWHEGLVEDAMKYDSKLL